MSLSCSETKSEIIGDGFVAKPHSFNTIHFAVPGLGQHYVDRPSLVIRSFNLQKSFVPNWNISNRFNSLVPSHDSLQALTDNRIEANRQDSQTRIR